MRRSRLALDIIMSLLLILQMLYLLVGEAYHEWAGLGLTMLFIVHNVLNRRWYKNVIKGQYTRRRILSTAINSACAVSIIALAASGISMARHSVSLQLLPMGTARLLHMLSAYWGFAFISMHAGLHMTGIVRKAAAKCYGKIVLAIIAIMGVAIFIKERFPSYMFLIEEFVFFDFSTPLPLLIAQYILLMGLFMIVGAGLSLVLNSKHITQTPCELRQ